MPANAATHKSFAANRNRPFWLEHFSFEKVQMPGQRFTLSAPQAQAEVVPPLNAGGSILKLFCFRAGKTELPNCHVKPWQHPPEYGIAKQRASNLSGSASMREQIL